MLARRSFLRSATSLAALGNLDFLGRLPPVSAAEATIDRRTVQFSADIEPLVRLLEDTARERVIEEFATRVRRGLSYREVIAALLLAGVRNIQPRPVGFKFHAVLVINSAHLASLASPDSDRWLPIFWAIDQFKSSQAANIKEGNWIMPPVDEAAVPPAHKARRMFIDAMDHWDEAAADTAVAGLARSAGADELFELFARYGGRDFRDIGHKAIFVANSFRCLEVIGWQHAEPVLRSLAYALLERAGAKENPAEADLPPDRPWKQNLELAGKFPKGWTGGNADAEAANEMLQSIRAGSYTDTSNLVLAQIKRGVSPRSIYDALFTGAGELLMQAPGIVTLHANTFSNAMHYSWRRAKSDETRRLLLLQNAAFLPLFRSGRTDKGIQVDELEPLSTEGRGEEAVAEIFADIGKDRLAAARKVLGYLKAGGSPEEFAVAARRLIFLKGTNSHDYKYSSAVLEDYHHISRPWRDRLLASSAFYLRGSGESDNILTQRIRSALGA